MTTETSGLEELAADAARQSGGVVAAAHRPQIEKVSYTHEGMIELIIGNPWISQNQIAAHFGYTAAWVSNILASDSFKMQLEKRREEVIDPTLRATIKERFEGLLIQSVKILMEKLDKPAVSVPDNVALRAAELGARALEVGGFGKTVTVNTSPPAPDHLKNLAERMVALQDDVRRRTLNGQAIDAEVIPAG